MHTATYHTRNASRGFRKYARLPLSRIVEIQSNTDCCMLKSGTLSTESDNNQPWVFIRSGCSCQAYTTSLTNPGSQYAASSKMITSPETPFNDCGAGAE